MLLKLHSHQNHNVRKYFLGILCGLPLLLSSCSQSLVYSHSSSTSAQAGQQPTIISWAAPTAITYGTALSAQQLNASSTVPGTFAYSPASDSVLDAGSHTLSVTFTPTDNTAYSSATTSVVLIVNTATPVLTWATPATITYGTPLSATQLDASSTVPGTFTYSPAAGTVLDAGCQTLLATFTPTDTTNYAAASITVNLAVTSSSYAFETSSARLIIQQDGTTSSLTGIPGSEELLSPSGQPFASVSKGGILFPATTFEPSGGTYHVTFQGSGISADYRITTSADCIVVQLSAIQGDGIDAIQLINLHVPLTNSGGKYLTARWDNNFTVSLMGLNDQVDTEVAGTTLTASAYPALAMEGQQVAILVAPTSQFLAAAQKVEHAFQLPSPTIDGVWAKLSPDNTRSYLFTDLDEANVDDTIRYALMGSFRYILIYSSTWSASVGSYPINTVHFPDGEAGLKSVIDKCHAAGLKVGMHMMTSLVAKNDPIVTPTPNAGLLKAGTTSLAVNLDAKAEVVTLTSIPSSYIGASLNDLAIDNEIIECSQISGAVLQQCTRGFAGTTATQHQAGAKAQFLAQAYGYYLADLQSPLASAISDRISGIINNVGFDMIFFDGGESNAANGPYWYWVGVQQSQIMQRTKRDLLVEGSGVTPWTWHVFTRYGCDDFAAVAVKQYLDLYKLVYPYSLNQNSFLPSELGWVGFLQDAPDHPATSPDELELHAVRMLALGLPIGLETRHSVLQANGRTEEMLKMLGTYEQLRLSGAVSAPARNQLASGQWHMTANGEFDPVQYEEQRITVPGQASVSLDASMPAQQLNFRLQVEPDLAAVGDPANIDLLTQNSSLEVQPPSAKDLMPGALSNRIAFVGTLDLTQHRALAVQLDVEGPAPVSGQFPVLNLQLEADGNMFRDYYVNLNFRGSKTIILPEPGTKRMLADFWPANSNYGFKHAMYLYNYQDVDALNVRWMRYPAGSGVTCSLHLIEALQERSTTLNGLTISAGSMKITIPGSMQTGDYAEYWGDGKISIFDPNGSLLQVVPANGAPLLGTGVNNFSVSASESGAVKLTAISKGN